MMMNENATKQTTRSKDDTVVELNRIVSISGEQQQQQHQQQEDSSTDSNEKLTPSSPQQEHNNSSQTQGVLAANDEDNSNTNQLQRRLESFTFYTPRTILILFTVINFVVYYDRGTPAAAIPYIRVDKDITGGEDQPPLSQTQCGALYSAFMFGFFIFNPICVALGQFWSSNKIILAGLCSWCVAVVLAGSAQTYDELLVARALTGVGESAYISFSVTTLDTVAPKSQRSLWLSIFYCTIPFGNAMGIALNSLVCATSFGANGGLAGWRMGFYLEAIPMAILIGFVIFLPDEYNVKTVENNNDNNNHEGERGQNTSANSHSKHVSLLTAVKRLLENKFWVVSCLGCIVYTAALGALSFFAVSMLVQSTFNITVVQASLLLGITTSAMGFIGSILGGRLLDRMKGGSSGPRGLYNSTWLMSISMILAIPLGFIALSADTFTSFCLFFVPAVFFSFLVTAPMATLILSVVPSELRPYSIAVNTFAIHLFGDLESPWITGKLADSFDGGCSQFDTNATLCRSYVVGGSDSNNNINEDILYCKFMEGSSTNEKTSCVNPQELFKAMRLVWMFMFLTMPTWGYLCYNFKERMIKSESEQRKTDDDAPNHDTNHKNGDEEEDVEKSKSSVVVERGATDDHF